MGLDQYWLSGPTAKEKLEASLTGYEHELGDVGYHRKFHSLNEFIAEAQLFWDNDHEINDKDFNCSMIPITPDAISDVKNWANHFITYADDDWESDQAKELVNDIIPDIERLLDEGKTIYYHPWW
jgi:hypothetical protein